MEGNPVKQVLLVDDDLLGLSLNSEILEGKGYKIFTATNGKIGLKMALELQPDLILMDMSMPIMNGYEATQTLRKQGYTGQIVAFTGNNQISEVMKAIEAGCGYVITKPVDADTFVDKIQGFINA